MRANLKVFEYGDNPHLLYYRCTKKKGVPERTEFNNGVVFKGGVETIVDKELLNALQSDVEELKDMLQEPL